MRTFEPRAPKADTIAIDGGQFRIEGKGQTIFQIGFDDILRMEAYKRDLFAVDLVCFDMWVDRGGETRVYTIHEELKGFDDLILRFESLEGFLMKWREIVILPPFEEQRTAVYVRPSRARG